MSTLLAAQWPNLEDVEAEDVVFQMVRQLVTDLLRAGYEPAGDALGGWWSRFVSRFKDIRVDGVELGPDPLKVSFTLAHLPADRRQVRDLLRGQLPTLFDVVNNEVLTPARTWLDSNGHGSDIVLIADELDRIPQKPVGDSGLTNHEALYLHTAGTLQALNCSIVYTVPIELAYSGCRKRLEDEYGGQIYQLPTIPVRNRDGADGPGLGVLHGVVARRATSAGIEISNLFADEGLLRDTLLMCGGHLRGLLVLLNAMLNRVDHPPLDEGVVRRSLRRATADAALPVRTAADWTLLDEVHQTKDQVGTDRWWNAALRDQWVLPYYEDGHGYWFDRHPTLHGHLQAP